MRFGHFEFGVIDIDGVTYEYDVVVDRGDIRRRKKKASKKFRDTFGHTPLSVDENIPWKCTCLVIGTGAHGRLPVMDDVKREARDRRVDWWCCRRQKPSRCCRSTPRRRMRSFMSHAD